MQLSADAILTNEDHGGGDVVLIINIATLLEAPELTGKVIGTYDITREGDQLHVGLFFREKIAGES